MTTTNDQAVADRGLPIKAIPVRHPGRWVAVAILLLLAAMAAHSLIANPTWRWDTFAKYFFAGAVLQGLVKTIWITAASMVLGIGLGVLIAVMRMSPNPVVKTVAWLYIWFFRGTPVLVQLVFWAFMAQLYKYLSLGIPFGPQFLFFSVNDLIPLLAAAVLGLGLNEAAYMAEIVRSGIMSVGKGQTEAAEALGMRRTTLMRRIVLPQAMRIIVPPTGNEVISMLKTTSILVVISVAELYTVTSNIASSLFQTIPLLMVASVWYLAVTTVLNIGQFYLERHFGRGVAGTRQQRARRKLAMEQPS